MNGCPKDCIQHLTSRSLEPACMYLSIKSRIVSHRAAKVVSESSGDRCCRNTWEKTQLLSTRSIGAAAH